ncbi:MAG TPA: hypothetical protein VNX25_10155 [Verrucomicrobiae bacterium]|nr:hypothetical protein [Verrucomicrobiae bacterium]
MKYGMSGRSLLGAAILCTALAGPAAAGLKEAGPADPRHGFPSWYRDNSSMPGFPDGIPLELCLDPAAGCILPILGLAPSGGWISEEPENYDPNAPLNFKVTGITPETPTGHVSVAEGGNFPGEAFFYYATGREPVGPEGNVVYIAGIEAAFAGNGAPAEGMQNPFVRVRIDLNKVPTGKYTVVHPYGPPEELVVEPKQPDIPFGDARYVSDIPLKSGAPFTDTASTMSRFLLPAAVTGGAPLPPITPDPLKPTEQFLSDEPGPVTNGPFGRNVVRVTGPAGATTISNFEVTGKISAAAMASTLTLSATPPSPTVAGTGVQFAVSSATAGREYRFALVSGGSEQIVRDWDAAATWTWDTTGVTPGTYSVRVDARDAGATAISASKAMAYLVKSTAGPTVPAASVKIIAAPSSPREPGTSVFFAAAAVGRAIDYEYRYSVLPPKSRTWGAPTDWSPTSTWTWNTTGLAPGIYRIKAEARAVGTDLIRAQSMPYTLK